MKTAPRPTDSDKSVFSLQSTMPMWIKNILEAPEFTAGDHCLLREVMHPDREPLPAAVGYSLAHARILPGHSTLPHRLRHSSELYIILEGQGQVHIDGATRGVGPGDLVLIPPGSEQFVTCTGPEPLVFYCIVEPAWRSETEEITGP